MAMSEAEEYVLPAGSKEPVRIEFEKPVYVVEMNPDGTAILRIPLDNINFTTKWFVISNEKVEE